MAKAAGLRYRFPPERDPGGELPVAESLQCSLGPPCPVAGFLSVGLRLGTAQSQVNFGERTREGLGETVGGVSGVAARA